MAGEFPRFGFAIWESGCWLRVFGALIIVKGPAMKPLFSERCGVRRPLLRAFGWRLFVSEKKYEPFAGADAPVIRTILGSAAKELRHD